MTTAEDRARPVVDPDGEFLWMPADVFETREQAAQAAEDYWPDKPQYDVWAIEYMHLRPVNEADEDEAAFAEEYGATSLMEPCDPSMTDARPFWPVKVYADPEG